MSDTENHSMPINASPYRSRGSWMPKFHLRTLLLMIAAAATWFAWFASNRTIQHETAQIEQLHVLAPELFIRNKEEIVCLQIPRGDDLREYEYYLPPGMAYQLNLSCRQDLAESGPLEADKSIPLETGRHKMIVQEALDHIIVRIDDKEIFDELRQPLTTGSTMSTGASSTFNSQWYPADKPLVIIRLREMNKRAYNPKTPAPGYALWIEPTRGIGVPPVK